MSRAGRLMAVAAVLVLAGCGGGSSPPPPPVAVSVSPSSVTLAPNASQIFKATVSNSPNPTVTWQVNNIAGGNSKLGTIDSFGVYVAPATEPSPPNVNVRAISQADPSKAGTALVTIGLPVGAANQQAQAFPIKLGTSGGDSLDTTTSGNTITCCSGTLGSLVQRGGLFYILSNNHVLARSDQAKLGEPITQPGLVDSNCNPATPVANLSQFSKLPTGGTTQNPALCNASGTPPCTDAALAQIIPGAVDTSGSILELGTASTTPNVPNAAPPASTTAAASVGMGVAKAGRSSGLTCSTVLAVHTSTPVDYSTSCAGGTTFTVEFNDLIVVSGGSFSAAGDSGSLIVSSSTAQPVGLLFAGDSTSTVGSPIGEVLNSLKDSNGNAPTIVGGGQHAVVCPKPATAAPASALATAPLEGTQVAHAADVANRYATRLMANPATLGVGVGRSQDAPDSSAVIIYVKSLPEPGTFPPQLDDVRTRIVPISAVQARSAAAAALAPAVLSEQEMARVSAIKEHWAHSLLRETPAIFGVGVGASQDSPGEAVVTLFVEKDSAYSAPPVLDGARTQVVYGDRFRAWGWNEHEQPRACSVTKHP